MRKPRPEREGSGFMSAGVEESSALEQVGGLGSSSVRLHLEEALPAFAGGHAAIAPQCYVVERLLGDVSETAVANVTVKALRAAVDGVEAGRRQEAAAAAWHAESVVRFLCATFGGGIAGVRLSEDCFIVIAAEFPENELVEATIAVGPDGTCACKITAGKSHVAATRASPARAFGEVLRERLAEVGVHGKNGVS